MYLLPVLLRKSLSNILQMYKLKFVQSSENDKAELLGHFSSVPYGTDFYTYIKLNSADEENGKLWCGKNEENEIRAVIFDDGSYNIRFDADNNKFTAARNLKKISLFTRPPFYTKLRFMIYNGTNKENGTAEKLNSKQILDAFHMMCETDELNDYSERKYIENVRAVNHSLADYVGIYKDGKIISCGGIVAKNEKYALIGNIFTRKEYRKNGYAEIIVNTLINTAIEQNLIPVLYCERKMGKYYKKIGFSNYHNLPYH